MSEIWGNTRTAAFMKALLILSLAVAFFLAIPSAAFGMPPHPDLLEHYRKGEAPLPDFVVNPDILLEKGINQPYRGPDSALMFPYAGAEKAPSGSYNALALLVDFSDNASSVGPVYFDTLIFGPGADTVKDYYEEVSYGTLTIVTVNLPSATGWFRAPQSYGYYVDGQNGFGSYPQNVQKLVEVVVDAADSVVDFSDYDNDGNGLVDALFVVHAGPGAELTGNPDDIWSHKWGIIPRLKDGVYISSYSMEPEYWLTPGDMTVGVYCHELGHVFGLPDLYDTDYSSEGVGDWSLMAGGSWNGYLGDSPAHLDAWSRIELGFATATVIATDTPGASIAAVENQPEIYYLWDCGAPNNEYFLVENRQAVGYDAGLPGSGLLIWHVDDNKYSNDSECRNHQNCACASHFLVALEQADGNLDLEYENGRGDSGDPYPGSSNNRTFDLASAPNSGSYADCGSQVAVRNIGNSGPTMTADFIVCGGAQALTRIDLESPPNKSTLSSPPTFTWVPDGGTNNDFVVDLRIDKRKPSTRVSGTSWTMPDQLWNRILPGQRVDWRIRGVDLDHTPLTVITSTQAWSFRKASASAPKPR